MVIHPTRQQINMLRDRIGVGKTVADELLVLSGGDIDLAEEASLEADGLDQCKANIIDMRFRRIEEGIK